MRIALAAVAALAISATAPQTAEAEVVVELYTSQGCSSCPPADEMLGRLTERDDVIALSLHVDYWDYLGWKDAFGKPEHSQRQRLYAAAAGSTMIYTPQMVVAGVDHVVGTRGMELAEYINKHLAKAQPVGVSATRSGKAVSIKAAKPASGAAGDMIVYVVQYSPKETVAIKRGENAGRSITYHNVVTNFDAVGEWSGKGALAIEAQLASDRPGAVIVQDGIGGAILGATRIK